MNVLVGISGGIAAYKVPLLIRLLTKNSHNVRVVATKNALEFVTELTLQTLSSANVYTDMFSKYNNVSTEHISLALWADVYIVCPATADIIGKYVAGIADDCLSTTLLAFNKQVFLCPAMNENMYYSFAVQRNLKLLASEGVKIIDSEDGFLACGTAGKGRMAYVDTIYNEVEDYFSHEQDFKGKNIIITAGATREKIDSVRFISNNSSGKMGYCIAKEFCSRGAKVNIISGNVNENIIFNHPNLNIIKVVSAEDIYKTANDLFDKADITVCAAAVADYTPEKTFSGKMKKQENNIVLNLKPTKDILFSLGQRKQNNQILVGFALETDNEVENAKSKLQRKNLDFIVLNSLNDKGAGFEVNTNKVTIIDKKGNINSLPLKSKKDVAKDIVNFIKDFL